jgi:hypothetical protein
LPPRFADNFIELLASETRGGIILAVDSDHFRITNSELGMYSVTAK